MAIRYNKKTEQLVFTGKEAIALDEACKECGKTPEELLLLAVSQLGLENVKKLATNSTKKKRRK